MGRKSTPVLLIRECIWALLDSLCLRAILPEPRWLDLLQTTLRVLRSQCWPCVTVCANDCSLAARAAGCCFTYVVCGGGRSSILGIGWHTGTCHLLWYSWISCCQDADARTPEAHYLTLFSPNQENPFSKDQKLLLLLIERVSQGQPLAVLVMPRPFHLKKAINVQNIAWYNSYVI